MERRPPGRFARRTLFVKYSRRTRPVSHSLHAIASFCLVGGNVKGWGARRQPSVCHTRVPAAHLWNAYATVIGASATIATTKWVMMA